MRKVKAIFKKKGETYFNLAADAANDDWIRSARLVKEGKHDELKRLEQQPTFCIDEEIANSLKKPSSSK